MDFLDLLIVMVVVWAGGRIFKALRLPIVFGELLGGVIVGPALLGLVDPDSEVITVLAELGVFFLMLHSGLHTNPEELFHTSRKSVLIALGGFVTPFLGAYMLAQWFEQPPMTSLFIAIGSSASAIALVTRLCKDLKLTGQRMVTVAMGAAIIQDILALICFSLIVSVAEQGGIDFLHLLLLLLKVCIFFAVVIYGGLRSAPYVNRFIYFGNKGFSVIIIIALAMGLIAELIGLHIVIGAFLAGLFLRQESIDERTFTKIEDRVYGLSYSFFGPIFFASLAFHLDTAALVAHPLFLLTVIIVAFFAKFFGSAVAAWFLKMSLQESVLTGLVMNNRGAVELIIASVGLQLGIIDDMIFSILVFMAFTTTLLSIVASIPCARLLRQSAPTQQ